MQALSRLKRLFSPVAGCLGPTLLAIYVCDGQSLSTDLSKDLNRSAFSTTSILADLANTSKRAAVTEIAPLSGSGTLVSSQPGAFQYNSDSGQSTSARKVTEEVRAAQELEDRQKAEVAAHPFWYARFWTHSPVAISACLAGVITMRSKPRRLNSRNWVLPAYLGTNYNSEAAVQKFEREVSFGNLDSTGGK